MKRGIHESVLPVKAAIGRAEQESLAPVPRRVITDCEPEISRPPEGEAHVYAVNENHDDANFVLAGIRKVPASKDDGEQQRRCPKTPASGQPAQTQWLRAERIRAACLPR